MGSSTVVLEVQTIGWLGEGAGVWACSVRGTGNRTSRRRRLGSVGTAPGSARGLHDFVGLLDLPDPSDSRRFMGWQPCSDRTSPPFAIDTNI